MNELLSYMSENSLLITCVCILIIIVIVVLIARRSATQKKSTNLIKSRKNLTLDDCVSRDDIQFKIDTYQRNLEQELSRSKKKINEAYKKHSYIRKRYKPDYINPIIREEVDTYEKTKSIDFQYASKNWEP